MSSAGQDESGSCLGQPLDPARTHRRDRPRIHFGWVGRRLLQQEFSGVVFNSSELVLKVHRATPPNPTLITDIPRLLRDVQRQRERMWPQVSPGCRRSWHHEVHRQ